MVVDRCRGTGARSLVVDAGEPMGDRWWWMPGNRWAIAVVDAGEPMGDRRGG